MSGQVEKLIQHEVKPSAVLALRPVPQVLLYNIIDGALNFLWEELDFGKM